MNPSFLEARQTVKQVSDPIYKVLEDKLTKITMRPRETGAKPE
jgi:hypothetical protein